MAELSPERLALEVAVARRAEANGAASVEASKRAAAELEALAQEALERDRVAAAEVEDLELENRRMEALLALRKGPHLG